MKFWTVKNGKSSNLHESFYVNLYISLIDMTPQTNFLVSILFEKYHETLTLKYQGMFLIRPKRTKRKKALHHATRKTISGGVVESFFPKNG